ncbi:MAG: hypothetical protein ACI4GD_12595 [Lachnospiraceae bacterium]
MNKKAREQKVQVHKVIIQCVISIVLIFMIYGLVLATWDDISEIDRSDASLEYRLARGEYGQCVDYFDTLSYLYGQEKVAEPEYARYKEFVEFYNNYMDLVIARGYDNKNNTDLYDEKIAECVDNMEHIRNNTTYFENEPHYDYLLELVKEEN